jgi:hypothetical protein
MRVVANGNLTVELIRAQRFDIACQDHGIKPEPHCPPCKDQRPQPEHPCVDRVELSPQALASDPWVVDAKRVTAVPKAGEDAPRMEASLEPEQLSPVVGSPALAGLGAAWVVPGTLLDVMA